MSHFPDNILTALKETVVKVFWKKEDVRKLFQRSGVPDLLIGGQDWQAYKYHIVSPVLDVLNSTRDGLGPLRRILQETLAYKDGDHLLWTNDGKKNKREAERCLEHLRLLVKDYDAAQATKEEERQARIKRAQEAKRGEAFLTKLDEIKARFLSYIQHPDPKERGYELEKILNDLFRLFELNPRGAFRRTGEQIDGSFVHDGAHFLLEAKWQQKPVNLADLRDFDKAVTTSFENTLGLFVSINGFSAEALKGYVLGERPSIICMDGADLMMVLDGKIDLSDLLRRKRDVAVDKRKIYVSASEIIQGAV